MKSSIKNYFDLAAKVATMKYTDGRTFFVGAIAVRKDGVIVGAPNGPTPYPDRKVHAEYRVCQKIDRNSIVYVVRILRKDFQFASAKPCVDCAKILASKKVLKVFYTIGPSSYGIWDVNKNIFVER